jgi:hypothetical protein
MKFGRMGALPTAKPGNLIAGKMAESNKELIM